MLIRFGDRQSHRQGNPVNAANPVNPAAARPLVALQKSTGVSAVHGLVSFRSRQPPARLITSRPPCQMESDAPSSSCASKFSRKRSATHWRCAAGLLSEAGAQLPACGEAPKERRHSCGRPTDARSAHRLERRGVRLCQRMQEMALRALVHGDRNVAAPWGIYRSPICDHGKMPTRRLGFSRSKGASGRMDRQ